MLGIIITNSTTPLYPLFERRDVSPDTLFVNQHSYLMMAETDS